MHKMNTQNIPQQIPLEFANCFADSLADSFAESFTGCLANSCADYAVVRSRRKSLALHISHGRVEVRCPLRISSRDINEFVRENRGWISNRLQEEAVISRQKLRVEPGGKIFYQGRERTVVFQSPQIDDSQPNISITPQHFIIHGPALNRSRAQKVLEKYLIQQAEAYLPGRARELAERLAVGHKLKQIRLRKTRSKWGHCTSDGIIQFNWLIMLAPLPIVDYLVTHEVCHLIHANHSPRYWRLVHSLCPDTPQHTRWLKKHEHRLWF